jgi:hypothetical protein
VVLLTVQTVKIIDLTIFALMRIKALLVFVITLLVVPYARGQVYAGSSVLKEGRWIRIAVTAPGIYRLDYSQIKDMGFADPSSVALYGNNRGQLSFYNDGTAPDDLRKIAFRMEKGGDGIFNEGDFILFYAEGTHRWRYNQAEGIYEFMRHNYSDTAWYFVTAKSGTASYVASDQPPSLPYNTESSSCDVFWRHEKESVNLIRSGREWYQQVTPGYENTIVPDLPGLDPATRLRYTIRVLGRSDTGSSFTFRQGTALLKTIAVAPVNMTDLNGVYASISQVEDSCMPSSSAPSFSLMFSNNGNLAATGYIDYADFFARAKLNYTDRQLFISDTRTVKPGGITRFTVTGSSSLTVWDITDPFNPKTIGTAAVGGNTAFSVATDSLRKFVVFAPAQVLYPLIRKDPVPNQDLHSLAAADMIIVTHPLFSKYAARLAEIHSTNDDISSVIVTPAQIYNEFSGGVPDAVAIRNFVKMIYDRGAGEASGLKYLLLFGDGSYENKTPPPGNPAYIPTWQSVNSYVGVLSFTSDDFYGLLGEGEGEATGYLDIGVGRLPAADTASAGIMVRKTEKYISSSAMGSWRNSLCMVADDEDSNLHMNDAEGLSEAVSAAAPPASVEKIYLDAYRQVTTVTGSSYPDAEKAINDRIAAGCLIFNYVGHGNETGLAHERVVRTDDINSWKNSGMLPLFITATCEFSRFDDVDINPATKTISARTSAGEMVLLNPDGGGIALMSTTRVVYSAPNYTLNRSIYDYAFARASDGYAMRLGDIIRLAKVNSGSGMNKRNFLLLGDPALRLAWPVQGKVVTDSINSVSVEFVTDTLKALSLITVSGHVEDSGGNLMTGFSGIVEPVVYDKAQTVTTLANDGGTPMTFPVSGSVIFRGTTEATEGRFRFSFIVPLDINYSYGKGMISYYAHDDNRDMNGAWSGITVGGFSEINMDDTDGPVIRLYMNDTLFREGGITDTSPSLLALIGDASGVNATGAGIGHDIIAWLDDDMQGAVVLNNLFRADIGVHNSGSLVYPMLITERGEHTVSLRAWDNLNNPSVATLRFVVETGGKFRLTDLLSYPNPVTAGTRFTAGHNRPDTGMEITVTVFNQAGSAVRVIKEQINTAGYALPDIPWDGCDSNGSRLARGVYLWRIEAVTDNGEKTSATGRIIIL